MRHETLFKCVAMFYICSCLAYSFNCGGNKEPKIDDSGGILVELSSPRWQTISKFKNIVCGKS